MASEGGAPGTAPGVTTLGCGRAGSCTCQGSPGSMGVSVKPRSPGLAGGACAWANTAVAMAAMAAREAMMKRFLIWVGFVRFSLPQCNSMKGPRMLYRFTGLGWLAG